MSEGMNNLVAPLHVSEKPLPPHDLEMYDDSGRVVVRWDGATLDELGSREEMRSHLIVLALAFNEKAARALGLRTDDAEYWRLVSEGRTSYGSLSPSPENKSGAT